MKTFLFLFLFARLSAQVDTIITNPAYISYYSFKMKAPLLVKYHLIKGGGDCDRNKFHFKAEPFTAHDADYLHGGYDKGHLADCEDFAYDCKLDELTFNYYNCFPQLPELNQGPWEELEINVRKLSQTDSLIIFCGGFYGKHKIGAGKIAVPDTCWKIVYNVKLKTFQTGYLFANVRRPKAMPITIEVLNALLKKRYGINITKQ